MDHEVVVVGAGIGGLTVAALLAARGVDVCVLERASNVGGCIASVGNSNLKFEQGYGIYSSWEPGDVHQQIFAALPVDPPQVRLLEPSYVVRLADGSQVSLTADTQALEQNLRKSFPECAGDAIRIYQQLKNLGYGLRRLLRRRPDFFHLSGSRQHLELLREGKTGAAIVNARGQTVSQQLGSVPARFRHFLDVQLRSFGQAGTDEASLLYAASMLDAACGGTFAITGGGDALANKLAESIRASGGKIRLDTPVLRLAYDSEGQAVGVDLLSGETVTAKRAIVSNLTVWDTYGKLIGLNRTPTEIRKQLKSTRSWSAYSMYLALDEDVATSLPASHLLLASDGSDEGEGPSEERQLLFAVSAAQNAKSSGKRAVTVNAQTEPEDWFTFHSDETESEQQDQQMLERCWTRLHAAMPELGSHIEVIETATPRGFYESTRRRLGMVNGLPMTPEVFWPSGQAETTSVSNLFMVGDTVAPGGVAQVTRSALELFRRLTK